MTTTGRAVCAPEGHLWMRGYRGELAWVLCLRCGTPGVCKVCMQERGALVAGLPDIFCTLHAPSAMRTPPTYAELARRLVHLAGTLPAASWHRDAVARCERAVVLCDGYQVHITHATFENDWHLLVYVSGQEAPALLAKGRSDALQLSGVQPGGWMKDVLHCITWRDVVGAVGV
jgi:hypothetical protein